MAFTLEELFQSMEKIVDSKVSNLDFDKTIICKIVDSSNSSEGRYTVSDESIVFEAYSTDTGYQSGNQVYVTIPKNDWSQKKVITGLYSTATGTADYVPMSEKIINLNTVYPKERIGVPNVWTAQSRIIYNTKLCNYVNISMQLQAYPTNNNYEPSVERDEYGFRVTIKNSETGKEVEMPIFSSSNMFGNPFFNYAPVNCEFGYQISNIENFSQFDIVEVMFSQLTPNKISISITDLKITYGFDTSSIENNTAIVVPVTRTEAYDGVNENVTEAEDGERWVQDIYTDVKVIWVNKDESNRSLGFIPPDADNPIYIPNISKATDKSLLDISISEDGTNVGEDVGKNYYWIDWYVDTEYAQMYLDDSDRRAMENLDIDYSKNHIDYLPQTKTIKLLRNQYETKVKALVWYNGECYESAPYAFVNEGVQRNLVSNLNIGISIDNLSANDTYRYDENNLSESEGIQTVCFNWSAYERLPDTIWERAIVEWKIPKEQTLLTFIEQQSKPYDIVDNDKFYIYRHIIDENDFEIDETSGQKYLKESARTYKYGLEPTYTSSDYNNLIYCKITLPDGQGSVSTSKGLSFGTRALGGTDYVFNISPVNRKFDFNGSAIENKNTIIIEGEEIIDTSYEYSIPIQQFKAKLLDAKGDEIDAYSVKWNKVDNSVSDKIEIISTHDIVAEVKMAHPLGYNVLVAEINPSWKNQVAKLKQYYPLSFSLNGEYVADTVTNIEYDSFGKLINPPQRPLKLYHIDENENRVEMDNTENYTWNIQTVYSKTGKKYDFAPSLQIFDNAFYINPSPFYAEGEIKSYNVLYATDYSGKILWSNPIIIDQNKFSNKLLNDWTGELKIDSEGNSVLTRAIGAGVKHEDNSFSGVFLGDIASHISDGLPEKVETGLLGYGHGEPAFGFYDNGKAFIGKSGQGRINFDGNKGLIASSVWQSEIDSLQNDTNSIRGIISAGINTSNGILIDLKNGHLGLRARNGNTFLFDNNGLDMTVNSLSVTSGTTTGINLLKQTAPPPMNYYEVHTKSSTEAAYFRKYWTTKGSWNGNDKVKVESDRSIVLTHSKSLPSEYTSIDQKVKFIGGKTYTLSFYYKTNKANTARIRIMPEEGHGNYVRQIVLPQTTGDAYEYYKIQYKFSEDITYRLRLMVDRYTDAMLAIYHLKLEEGAHDTPWTVNDEDNNLTYAVSKINQESISSSVFGLKDFNYNFKYYGYGPPNASDFSYLTTSDKNVMYLDYKPYQPSPTASDANEAGMGTPYRWTGSTWSRQDENNKTLSRQQLTGMSVMDQTINYINAEVFDGGTNEGFGWNLNSSSFTLYSTKSGSGQNKVFYCDDTGVLIGDIEDDNTRGLNYFFCGESNGMELNYYIKPNILRGTRFKEAVEYITESKVQEPTSPSDSFNLFKRHWGEIAPTGLRKFTYIKDQGEGRLYLEPSGTNAIIQQKFKAPAGGTYRYSFWYEAPYDSSGGTCMVQIINANNDAVSNTTRNFVTATGDSAQGQMISGAFTLTKNATYTFKIHSSRKVYIKDLKLESGDKITPWAESEQNFYLSPNGIKMSGTIVTESPYMTTSMSGGELTVTCDNSDLFSINSQTITGKVYSAGARIKFGSQMDCVILKEADGDLITTLSTIAGGIGGGSAKIEARLAADEANNTQMKALYPRWKWENGAYYLIGIEKE